MNNKLHEILEEKKKSMHANLIVVFPRDTKLGTAKTAACTKSGTSFLASLH